MLPADTVAPKKLVAFDVNRGIRQTATQPGFRKKGDISINVV